MDEQNRKKKLAELEKTLAEELDQNVRNLGANISGEAKDNSAQVIKGEALPPSGMVSTGSSGENDDEVSLSDLDDILNTVDPTFQKSLDDLTTNIKGVEKDIQINTDDLVEDEESAITIAPEKSAEVSSTTTKNSFADRLKWFLEIPKRIYKSFTHGLRVLQEQGIKRALVVLKEEIPKLIEKLKTKAFEISNKAKAVFKAFVGLKSSAKWLLILFVISVVAISAYLKLILSGQFISNEVKHEFLGSFLPVADRIVDYDEDEPLEDFDNPVRNPDFTFLARKVMANVQPSAQSGTKPMVAFQVYLEASNQEAAIELKNREREVLDYLARTAENLQYDEWVTEEGKNRFRTLARRRINEVLNNGRVQRIFFKTVFYKP